MPNVRVLFLNPPSISKLDTAGARFQARRKANTLWYPIWLAYGAGVLENECESFLIDCPAEGIELPDLSGILAQIRPQVIAVYTSTPGIQNDISICREMRNLLGDVKIVLLGPHVTVLPEETLLLSEAVWGAARGEFEYTILELARVVRQGGDYKNILGLSWKNGGKIVHNPPRPLLENLNDLPFVTKVYKKHLHISNYYLSFALHPYVSVYASRGCPSRCTFCLWPQTISGHKPRLRTPENVVAEMEYILRQLPTVKEIFFDDDTFTADPDRVHRICELIKERNINISWSANARANVDLPTLQKMKSAGCRLLVVGYESANQEILTAIKKGVTLSQMEVFTENARKAGIMLHGAFIIGLPGETKNTINNTIEFAKRMQLASAQFSIATPLPGTGFYQWCRDNDFLKNEQYNALLDKTGYQNCVVEYPGLSAEEISEAVDRATEMFYFRPSYLLTMLKQAVRDYRELKRILLGGPGFMSYCIQRRWKKYIKATPEDDAT
jgi:radical SAM superfamily enzyme YgiQ (UPF0313 family)